MSSEDIVRMIEMDDTEDKKQYLREFFVNRDIPYEEKERVWFMVPEGLSRHNYCVVDLECYENKYGEINWYDFYSIEKYQTVDLYRLCVDLRSGAISWLFEECDDPEDNTETFIK